MPVCSGAPSCLLAIWWELTRLIKQSVIYAAQATPDDYEPPFFRHIEDDGTGRFSTRPFSMYATCHIARGIHATSQARSIMYGTTQHKDWVTLRAYITCLAHAHLTCRDLGMVKTNYHGVMLSVRRYTSACSMPSAMLLVKVASQNGMSPSPWVDSCSVCDPLIDEDAHKNREGEGQTSKQALSEGPLKASMPSQKVWLSFKLT